jgi:glutamate synthase domain-containing protein 2
MYFFKRGGWEVQFTEADLKTPLPRKLTFSDPEKIRELARRGEAWGTSEVRQMLEHAIETGRGGVYLRLTPEQHAKLRRPVMPASLSHGSLSTDAHEEIGSYATCTW